MVINNNMSSAFVSRVLGVNNSGLLSSMEKLSSGIKINKAGDDASGLAVSEKMRSQIRGLNQASRNISDAISFSQVSEGYLAETTNILQRIRELAVQSSNGVYSDEDRMMLQVEVSQLVAEVDRIASSAQFNGMNMLTGRFSLDSDNVMQFQIGANVDQNIRVYIGAMTAEALGLKNIQGEEGTISVSDPEQANSAVAAVDYALSTVNKQRADLGAPYGDGQAGHRHCGREHTGGGIKNPRHRYGQRNGGVCQELRSFTGRSGDARSGELQFRQCSLAFEQLKIKTGHKDPSFLLTKNKKIVKIFPVYLEI